MRRRALSIIALCGLIAIAMLPARAASVTPTKVDGGSTCATVDSAGTFSPDDLSGQGRNFQRAGRSTNHLEQRHPNHVQLQHHRWSAGL